MARSTGARRKMTRWVLQQPHMHAQLFVLLFFFKFVCVSHCVPRDTPSTEIPTLCTLDGRGRMSEQGAYSEYLTVNTCQFLWAVFSYSIPPFFHRPSVVLHPASPRRGCHGHFIVTHKPRKAGKPRKPASWSSTTTRRVDIVITAYTSLCGID